MVCKHQRHRGDGGRGDTGQAHSFFPLHSADLHESQMTLSVGPWWRTAQAAATVRENSLEMAGQSLAGTLLRSSVISEGNGRPLRVGTAPFLWCRLCLPSGSQFWLVACLGRRLANRKMCGQLCNEHLRPFVPSSALTTSLALVSIRTVSEESQAKLPNSLMNSQLQALGKLHQRRRAVGQDPPHLFFLDLSPQNTQDNTSN